LSLSMRGLVRNKEIKGLAFSSSRELESEWAKGRTGEGAWDRCDLYDHVA